MPVNRLVVARPPLSLNRSNLTTAQLNQQRLTSPSQLDSFAPAPGGALSGPGLGLTPPNAMTPSAPVQSTPTAPSSSSGGISGFFSNLWGGIKNFFGGLLGQASQSIQQQAPSFASRIGSFVSGIASQAFSWLGNLVSGWASKLTS
jgi:hypothetical protein